MNTNSMSKKAFKLSMKDLVPISIGLIIFFLTWLFMHGAEHFLLLSPASLGKYFQFRWVLIAHITARGGALMLGILQFWKTLRLYSAKVHRIIGLLYLLAIMLSSLCAVILAFTTAKEVNWAYAFSLQVWVSVWISSTAVAYYAAVVKQFHLHQQWMVRSYLVTLAFIISGLALKIPAMERIGTFADISPSFFWMGWSVPLFIYQLLLDAKKLN